MPEATAKTAQKTTRKKTAAKKVAKKPVKKTTAKRVAAKKSTAKKAVSKRVSASKSAAKRSTAKLKSAAQSSDSFVDLAKAEEVAKQVWYAGLGAYALSFDVTKASYEKVNEQGVKLFNDMVSRGEKLQDEAESVLKEQRDVIEERFTDARKSVDEIVDKVDVPGRVKQIVNRIESLSMDLRKAS